MRPAEAEGWIEHSAVRVLLKSSALQWECHLSNGINFFLGQRSIVWLRKMLATTPFPQAVVELAQKAPWQTSVWEADGSSMPRAAVGALTFPSEQVERQLREIVADRLS